MALETVGLKAVIEGLSAYVADLKKMDDATGNAGKQLDTAGQKAGGFTNKVNGMGKAVLAAGAAFAVGFVTTKAVGQLNNFIDAASDLNESLSKVGVVFGENADEIDAWAKTAAESMGLSRQEALEAAGTFGNLFDALGLTGDQTKDMSMDIIELSADLASFNNLDPTEVLEKLRSGLVGEAEPLRSLGVNINEATVKAKAMELGLGDLNGNLTDAEKVQARYALILEQTTNAQGDFARTADGAANQSRILNATYKDMQAELGTGLLPAKIALTKAMIGLIGTIRQDVVPGVKEVVRLFKQDWLPIIKQIGTVMLEVADILRPIFEFWIRRFQRFGEVVSDIVKLIKAIFTGDFAEAWDLAKSIVAMAIQDVTDQVKSYLEVFRRAIAAVFEVVLEVGERVFGDLIRSVGRWLQSSIIEPVAGIVGTVREKAAAVWGTIQATGETAFGEVIRSVSRWLSSIVGAIGSFVGSVRDKARAVWEGIQKAGETVIASVKTWLENSAIADILGAIAGWGDELYTKGSEAMHRLWDGLQDVWDQITGWLSNLNPMDWMPDLPSIPGLGMAPPSAAPAVASAFGASGGAAVAASAPRMPDPGAFSLVLPALSQRAAASTAGPTYTVNATYVNPQDPASIRIDLIQMQMAASL